MRAMKRLALAAVVGFGGAFAGLAPLPLPARDRAYLPHDDHEEARAAHRPPMLASPPLRSQGWNEEDPSPPYALHVAEVAQESEEARQEPKSNTVGIEEAYVIQPIDRPFLQSPEEWEAPGKGISLTVSGEPKSGTTWLARIVVRLALHLCGNAANPWCSMGGLTATGKINPAPRYDFEMLNAQDGTVFAHFNGKLKHQVFGVAMKNGCERGMTFHPDGFGEFPCQKIRTGRNLRPTREQLLSCLPDTSPACVGKLPFMDPARRRMIVVVRDPRNVVISEYKMRTELYHHKLPGLNKFVHDRMEAIVAWITVRWTWHTTALGPISHVLFYEDLKANHSHLVGIAAFIGLECTQEDSREVWHAHHRHMGGDDAYAGHGLPVETIQMMNATMLRLLPEPLVARYGLRQP